jgi:hypothetical protein
MCKFILTEEDRNRIKKLYGLLNEQKYVPDYSEKGGNLLDFCGYRAIEAFEETKGDPSGKSMGEDYFESKITEYEKLITNRIENTIGLDVFSKFPPKLKMQVWSFMFNGTDASDGTIKWIAGLNQAMLPNMDKMDVKDRQNFRLKIMQNSTERYNAIERIKNFNGDWNVLYNKYLLVLDEQHQSTAINNKKQGSYNNSWKFRPTDLDRLYNKCPKQSTQRTTQTTGQRTTQTTAQNTNPTNNVNEFEIFADNPQRFLFDVKTKSQNQSIDTNSVNLIFDTSKDNYKLYFKKGNTTVKYLTIALNMVDDEKNKSFPSKDTILSKNPCSFVVKENVFNDANGQRRWAVIAIV